MEDFFFDVFIKDERQIAELRLTPEEVFGLEQLGAVCTPMDLDETEIDKQWYVVTIPVER